MATPLSTMFSSYELAEEEKSVAISFNNLQLIALKNKLSIAAHNLVSLEPENMEDSLFHLKRAALQGQVKLLVFLIERSEVVTTNQTQVV